MYSRVIYASIVVFNFSLVATIKSSYFTESLANYGQLTSINKTFEDFKSESTEYTYLYERSSENAKRVTFNLAARPEVDKFQIEQLRSVVTETIYTIFLSRLLPADERRHLLQLCYGSHGQITKHVKEKDPHRYPPVTNEEKSELQVMIDSLEEMKVSIVRLVYYGKRSGFHASTITERISKTLVPIKKRLQEFHAEYDPDYRKALIIESFVVECTMFVLEGPNDYTFPTGISHILAHQTKRRLVELDKLLKQAFDDNRGAPRVSEILHDVRFELSLLFTFEILNGEVSRETDKVLRELRVDYIAFNL